MSFELDSFNVDQARGNNATLYLNDVEVSDRQGDYTLVEAGDTLKLVADEGYAITYAVIDYKVNFFDRHTQKFTIEDEGVSGNVATLVWSDSFAQPDNQVDVGVTSEQAEVEERPVGFNKVYQVNIEEMANIAASRFVKIGSADAQDYGEYIVNVIEIPTSIPSDYVGKKEAVQLGPAIIEATATGIASDRITIDMGTIETPAPNDNFLDLEGVICTIHLPYTKSMTIDPYYVVGETIKIEYLIDLYNGNTTINMYSTKVGDEVFLTDETTLGIDIPYVANTIEPNINNSNMTLGGNNRILIPYLEIARPITNNTESFFNLSVTDEGSLDNYTGFVQILNSQLSVNDAFANELDTINSMLAAGITINPSD